MIIPINCIDVQLYADEPSLSNYDGVVCKTKSSNEFVMSSRVSQIFSSNELEVTMVTMG